MTISSSAQRSPSPVLPNFQFRNAVGGSRSPSSNGSRSLSPPGLPGFQFQNVVGGGSRSPSSDGSRSPSSISLSNVQLRYAVGDSRSPSTASVGPSSESFCVVFSYQGDMKGCHVEVHVTTANTFGRGCHETVRKSLGASTEFKLPSNAEEVRAVIVRSHTPAEFTEGGLFSNAQTYRQLSKRCLDIVPGRDCSFSVYFDSDKEAGTITPVVQEKPSPDTVTGLPNFDGMLRS